MIIYVQVLYIYIYMIWSYCDHHVIWSSRCRELYDTEKYSIRTFATIIRLPLPTTCPLPRSGTLRISTGTAQLWKMDCPGVRKPSRWHHRFGVVEKHLQILQLWDILGMFWAWVRVYIFSYGGYWVIQNTGTPIDDHALDGYFFCEMYNWYQLDK